MTVYINSRSIAETVRGFIEKPLTLGWLIVVFVLAVGAFMLGEFNRNQLAFRGSGGADLTAFVESVKSQLEKVEVDRVKRGDPALFTVKGFDLELIVVAKNESKGSAGVKAEVVTADMQQQLSREVSQKIILHMMLATPEAISIKASSEPISSDKAEDLGIVKLKEKSR